MPDATGQPESLATAVSGTQVSSARIMQARRAALQLPPEDWADELAGISGQHIGSLRSLRHEGWDNDALNG